MAIDERSVPDSNYPLASQQGVPIPLDVAKPLTGFYDALAAGGHKNYTLTPSKFNLISVYCTQFARLSSIPDAVEDEDPPVASTFIMIPNMLYELNVDKNITITSLAGDAGVVVLNQILRWDQLYNVGAYGVSR